MEEGVQQDAKKGEEGMAEEADGGAILEEGVYDTDFKGVQNIILGFEGVLQLEF